MIASILKGFSNIFNASQIWEGLGACIALIGFGVAVLVVICVGIKIVSTVSDLLS